MSIPNAVLMSYIQVIEQSIIKNTIVNTFHNKHQINFIDETKKKQSTEVSEVEKDMSIYIAVLFSI